MTIASQYNGKYLHFALLIVHDCFGQSLFSNRSHMGFHVINRKPRMNPYNPAAKRKMPRGLINAGQAYPRLQKELWKTWACYLSGNVRKCIWCHMYWMKCFHNYLIYYRTSVNQYLSVSQEPTHLHVRTHVFVHSLAHIPTIKYFSLLYLLLQLQLCKT